MRPQPGEIIGGKYRIIRLIGDGGMGAVYEARHEMLGTTVALKFLHVELAKRPGLVDRFLREARVSATIQSPHVVRVTDVDRTPNGSAYLVMDLLHGESLQQVLDRRSRLPLDEAVDVALQMLAGLEAAHGIGVVHRDLKPDNVFVVPSTGGIIVKLLDFGIAKLRQTDEYKKGLTHPGVIMGTPEYMAPEQAFSADQVDHRADLYSLGVILFEMLCGMRPADGDDAHQIVEQIVTGRTRRLLDQNPTLPAGLAAVVERALAPDPTARPSCAAELRLALAPFAGTLSQSGQLAAVQSPVAPAPPRDAAMPGSSPPYGATAAMPMMPPSIPGGGGWAPSGIHHGAPLGGSTGTHPPTAPGSTQPDGQRSSTASMPIPVFAPAPASYSPSLPHSHALAMHAAVAPPPPGRSRRAIGAVIAILLGAALAGTGVWLYTHRAPHRNLERPPMPQESVPPMTTLTSEAPLPMPPAPAAPAGEPPAPQPPRRSSSPSPATPRTPARPETDPGTSRTQPSPGLPIPGFSIPSSFPPLPSAIPPGFPTTLPPIPGFPGPRQPEAPATPPGEPSSDTGSTAGSGSSHPPGGGTHL